MTEVTRGSAESAGSPPPARLPRPWWIYRGTGLPSHDIDLADILPPPPPWRRFNGGAAGRLQPPAPPEDDGELARRLGVPPGGMRPDATEADIVNAALILRRPLLVTGRPGTGKSTLAYRISRELGLGRVLRWPITSHSTLASGLYAYDAVGRVQAAATASARASVRAADVSGPDIGPSDPLPDDSISNFLQLGPLGTALLPYELPRVLLVDEFDKSDMDFPNDLLDVFEAGEFTIPELQRLSGRQPEVVVPTYDHGCTAAVVDGRVRCQAFPVVVITSNGEREFPPAFLRRCLHLRMPEPTVERLSEIVAAHLGVLADDPGLRDIVHSFAERSRLESGLATDQLLNALYLSSSGARTSGEEWQELLSAVWQRLDSGSGRV